jgi:hypothetical protein
VPVRLADEFAAVAVAEVESEIARVEFEHIPGAANDRGRGGKGGSPAAR